MKKLQKIIFWEIVTIYVLLTSIFVIRAMEFIGYAPFRFFCCLLVAVYFGDKAYMHLKDMKSDKQDE